ncbi:selenoprotein F [Oratosquilla oratoria]|uniref:selenoprotein F n=1 Tax=Oratosquilla oratoria TaxID=337810 RepID=UPI003F77657F
MADPPGIVLYVLGVLIALVESLEFSAEECFAKGLNQANLMCSSCDTLKEFNLDILEASCRGCCLDDDELSSAPTKYPRAQLEVCG